MPTKKDKSPAQPTNWKNGFEADKFADAYGIGLICGQISRGLECLDFDNHFGDARKIMHRYLEIPEVKEIYQHHRLPIESTMSGGFHLLFRCDKNEGNRKLALRLSPENRPEAIIETRGEGGYFVASPTPGYSVIRNDIFSIATISEIERAILIDNAASLNEWTTPIKTEYENNDRPGDLYNRSTDATGQTISLLKESGWTEVTPDKWRRPGKKEGISATFGKVAPNVFYVFSSNAYPFDSNKAYLPFQVLALLKFNGDFKAAAESLPKPEKTVVERNARINESELEKILSGAAIDVKTPIEKPPTILYIRETDGATSSLFKRLFTLGNFSCIIGKAKSKKTFFLTMVTAAVLRSKSYDEKLKGDLPFNKRTVLYFDTEQGDYDAYNTIKRIELQSGTTENLKAFKLRQFSPVERCQIIEYAFRKWGEETGFCVIDGIADLSNGINDEDEATRVSTMLLRLTKVYNCHICTVIHQNKNDNFATGHLGSAVTKKAEIIISVLKDGSDRAQSEVNCDNSRGVDFDPFTFRINGDGLPEIIAKKSSTKSNYFENYTEKDTDFSPLNDELPF